mmetsp:Transcript_66289/g.194414  ORF Transcript_66289/g.194414 Transcript_66289/m.194414 type:complete len:204 (-) Transcript_66289:2-613(-)
MEASSAKCSVWPPRKLRTSSIVALYGSPRSCTAECPSTSSSKAPEARASPPGLFAPPGEEGVNSAALGLSFEGWSEPAPPRSDTDSFPGCPEIENIVGYCCSLVHRPPWSLTCCRSISGRSPPRSERRRLCRGRCESSWISCESSAPSSGRGEEPCSADAALPYTRASSEATGTLATSPMRGRAWVSGRHLDASHDGALRREA